MELTKLIITIPKDKYRYIQGLERGNTDYATTRMLYHAVIVGTPLESVKSEIVDQAIKDQNGEGFIFLGRLLRIFNNIGKESEGKPNE